MRKGFSRFLYIIISLASIRATAQNPLREGLRLFEVGYYAEAIPHLEKAVVRDSSLVVLEDLGYCYYKTKKFKEAEEYYRAAFQIPYYSETTPYYLAETLRYLGKYDDAISFYELCKYYPDANPSTLQLKVESCYFAKKKTAQKKPFEITAAKEINTAQSDCINQVLGKTLFISSDRKSTKNSILDPKSGAYNFRVFSCQWEKSDKSGLKLSRPKPFDGGLLSDNYHFAFPTFYHDSREMFFVSVASTGNKSISSRAQINYASSRNGKKFERKFDGDFVNSLDHSNLQPCYIAENNIVVFSSDRAGGQGGYDLYYIDLNKGIESEAINLGKEINTSGNDVFPTYHKGYLYFASEGKLGLGGLDIYRAAIDPQKIGKVEWLNAPINSSADDFSLNFDSEESIGFFSSNREGGKGQDDIYYFQLKNPTELKQLLSTD